MAHLKLLIVRQSLWVMGVLSIKCVVKGRVERRKQKDEGRCSYILTAWLLYLLALTMSTVLAEVRSKG